MLTYAEIRAAVSSLLQDPTNSIYSTTELDVAISEALTQVSLASGLTSATRMASGAP